MSNKTLKWNILKRIQRLPADQIGLVRRMTMHFAGCTQSKYYRVMQENDNDVNVLIALAKVLKCKVDDVLNPAYEFKDPQLDAAQVDRLCRDTDRMPKRSKKVGMTRGDALS